MKTFYLASFALFLVAARVYASCGHNSFSTALPIASLAAILLGVGVFRQNYWGLKTTEAKVAAAIISSGAVSAAVGWLILMFGFSRCYTF